MIRALIVGGVHILMVLTVGTFVLLVGLIHPSRRLFAIASSLWARSILLSSGVKLIICRKEEALNEPRLLVANHQSALDIPILIAAMQGDLRFMAKDSLFRIPLFGWVLKRYGMAPIDRSHARRTAETLDRMLLRLKKRPISFAVFPEGTRTKEGKMMPFRRGTMKIAQRTNLPIIPVTIDGSWRLTDRGRFHVRPGTVRLTMHPSIPAADAGEMSAEALRDRLVQDVAGALTGASNAVADVSAEVTAIEESS